MASSIPRRGDPRSETLRSRLGTTSRQNHRVRTNSGHHVEKLKLFMATSGDFHMATGTTIVNTLRRALLVIGRFVLNHPRRESDGLQQNQVIVVSTERRSSIYDQLALRSCGSRESSHSSDLL